MDKSADMPKENEYQLEKEFQGKNTMESINKYLQIKYKLNIAADHVLKEQKDIHQMAKRYRLEYSTLRQKINIMQSLEQYIEDSIRYEKAVQAVLKGEALITASGEKYGVDITTLCNEIAQFYDSTDEKYKYDRSLDSTRIFTFKQEMLLLKYLELWKEKIPFCSCASCAMEELLNIAYRFAQRNEIKYPPTWDIEKRASARWLISYEMTYSDMISQLVSYNDCFRVPIEKPEPFCFCYISKLRKREQEIQYIKKKLLNQYYF